MTTVDSRPIILDELNPEDIEQLAEKLARYASALSLPCTPSQAEACIRHLLYVEQVNEYINMTRINDLDDAVVLHVLDSLTLLPYIPEGISRMLDMGTGPGFPGIPLSIVSGLPGDLLDSVGKKIKAVNAVIDALELKSVHAVHDRLEDYARKHRAEYDLVVARALAPIPILLEFASPLTSKGGYLLISKGQLTEDEASAGEAAAKITGFSLEERVGFELPDGYGHREILRYRKSHQAALNLPRATGMAKKNPLA